MIAAFVTVIVFPLSRVGASDLPSTPPPGIARIAVSTGFVLLTLGCGFSGWSFTNRPANLVTVLIAMVESIRLAHFSRQLPRAWLSLLCRIGVAVGCLLVMLSYGISFMLTDAPSDVDMSGGMHCLITPESLTGDLSGRTVKLFRRYGVIDHLLDSRFEWDNYSNTHNDIPAEWKEPFARCGLR